jgi:hypothetical protein
MKKNIFIIFGILIALIIVAVWAYLFLYGTPKSANEVFARFGMNRGGSAQTTPTNDTHVDVAPTDTTSAPQRLKQLTTRPVAGTAFTPTDGITYVEQGTGHLYTIDLTTGTEKLLGGATIPKATRAVFSKNGTYVAISAYTPEGVTTVVRKVPTSDADTETTAITLPLNASEIQFGKATGTVQYAIKESTGSKGYLYSVPKKTSTQLFAIPLRDIHVLWGDPLYVYTTPSAQQTGYIYKVVTNELTYVTKGAPGLVAFKYQKGIVASAITKDGRDVSAIDGAGKIIPQSLYFIPEKCTTSQTDSIHAYCATPTNITDGVFPDDWYKGVIAYNDILWSMDISTGESTFLVDFLKESGREMDVVNITADSTGKYLSLINKNDNTLWLFDTTTQPNPEPASNTPTN